jgi:hypothetical protein
VNVTSAAGCGACAWAGGSGGGGGWPRDFGDARHSGQSALAGPSVAPVLAGAFYGRDSFQFATTPLIDAAGVIYLFQPSGNVLAIALTGVNATVGSANASVLWQASTCFPAFDGWSTGTSYMAVGSGSVFVMSGCGPQLVSFSAASGAQQWARGPVQGNVEASPAIDPGNKLWFAGREEWIHVVDPLTGNTAAGVTYGPNQGANYQNQGINSYSSLVGAPTSASGYNCARSSLTCWTRSTLAFDAVGNAYNGAYDNNFGGNGGLLSMNASGAYRWWAATGCSIASPSLSAAFDVVYGACAEGLRGMPDAFDGLMAVLAARLEREGGGSDQTNHQTATTHLWKAACETRD